MSTIFHRSDAAGTENRNSVGNGTTKTHGKLERKNSKKQAKQVSSTFLKLQTFFF